MERAKEDMVASSHRGLFVVFEGLDRSGKSTQSARLVQHLESEGHKVRHVSFPGMRHFLFFIVKNKKAFV